jgi:thiol-disulfide isomerase/thioredoxin
MTVQGPMLRRLAIVLAAAALVTAVLPLGEGEARVGARLPSFTLPAIPGGSTSGRFDASEYIGEKPMAILFWATWCQPCRQELPFYQALYQRYREQGLVVVAISMDNSNSLGQAGPTVRRLGLSFPVVSDLDTSTITRLNPRRAAPFSIWVDHRGRITREHEGFSMSEREEIGRGIARLVRAAQNDD